MVKSKLLLIVFGLVAATAGLVLSPGGPTTAAVTSVRAPGAAVPSYAVLGQPDLASTSLGTRCSDPDARFNQQDFGGGFVVDGPTGIAIGPRGRLFVADDGGHRILSWPDAGSLQTCQAADLVIGKGNLSGPEAITVDGKGWLYVADTLDHTVKIFTPSNGAYHLSTTLGSPGTSGNGNDQFFYPRGVAVGEDGQLFVADDFNNRILIFEPPFAGGEQATDSIYAGNNGGFSAPKALSLVGDNLFVADYDNGRVLRFTGPFDTPDQTYTATGVFNGLTNPVDLVADPDGNLYVSDQSGGGTQIALFPAALDGPGAAAPSSTSSEQTTSALGLATDASGHLFVADYSSYRVVIRSTALDAGPADPAASAAAVGLLADFRARASRGTHRVALGQEMATFKGRKNTGWYRDFYRLHQQRLPQPKIMSTELSFLMDNRNDAALATMKAFAANGGIIAIDWHPDNPINPNHYDVPMPNSDLAQLTGPDSQTRRDWRAQLDRAAAALAQFQAAGIPVIFRPFVEMNIHYIQAGTPHGFWWGDDFSRGAQHSERTRLFRALWDDTLSYLTVEKALHNLLFDYSTNSPGYGSGSPALDYYPGSDSVDLVGIDVYQTSLNLDGGNRGLNTYEALVSTGKPFGLSEFGQNTDPNKGKNWDARTVVKRVRDSYPETVYAIAWYSLPSEHTVYGLSDLAHVSALLKDPLVRVVPYRK